jgi:hypothetical protein
MNNIFTILKEELQWDDKRVDFLEKFIEGLIKAKTVNLSEISNFFDNTIKKESAYRRIQRFFKDFNISFTRFAKLLMKFIPEEKRILIIDRTEWGDVNIFFLAIEYQGVAIPVLWEVLEKKGSTNTLERISLIEDYVNVFGKENIKYLTADREFIGKDWFKWLKDNEIKLLIRLKKNFLIEVGIKGKKKVGGYYRYYESKSRITELFGIELKIMGKRINSGELLILATNAAELEIEDYSKRWGIETMFLCLKSHGFNLEDTKMTENYKIDKLIALISLAYSWCLVTGKRFKNKDSRYRKDLGYYSKSIFKIGIERLRSCIFDKVSNHKLYSIVSSLFCSIINGYSSCVVE